MATQFQTWRVCQLCGRASPSDNAEGWLVSPHRTNIEVTIVRCPEHISEWSLRQAKIGRTKAARQLAADGKKMPVPAIPAHLSPFPTREKEV